MKKCTQVIKVLSVNRSYTKLARRKNVGETRTKSEYPKVACQFHGEVIINWFLRACSPFQQRDIPYLWIKFHRNMNTEDIRTIFEGQIKISGGQKKTKLTSSSLLFERKIFLGGANCFVLEDFAPTLHTSHIEKLVYGKDSLCNNTH